MTATTTPSPLVTPHASGVWIICMCHWRLYIGSSGSKRGRRSLRRLDAVGGLDGHVSDERVRRARARRPRPEDCRPAWSAARPAPRARRGRGTGARPRCRSRPAPTRGRGRRAGRAARPRCRPRRPRARRGRGGAPRCSPAASRSVMERGVMSAARTPSSPERCSTANQTLAAARPEAERRVR